ncbi:RNA polymerase sigma factor SigZ [Labrenzia sp. PHM005]|nr:RNA polymerase sigma factor SigZ [Labrenzia sp. PHM005]
MTLEDVWNGYRGQLKAFLHSRVSNPADVDDLLQEISIKVFAGLKSLKHESKLQSWLYQTAQNAIVDHYRRDGRGKDLAAEDLWYDKDETTVRQQLEGCIRPFIAALPEETAQLLTAIDLNGQPQKAYAAEHGLGYSTLKSRVQTARSSLRGLFEDCCRMSLDANGNIADYSPKGGSCKNC